MTSELSLKMADDGDELRTRKKRITDEFGPGLSGTDGLNINGIITFDVLKHVTSCIIFIT